MPTYLTRSFYLPWFLDALFDLLIFHPLILAQAMLKDFYASYFRQVICLFRSIFTDSIFAGKQIIPDSKHSCKNGLLFI